MNPHAPAAAATPRPLPGPGWFDSSWELASGLEVCEGWPPEVELGVWLDGFLRQVPSPAGAALSAEGGWSWSAR